MAKVHKKYYRMALAQALFMNDCTNFGEKKMSRFLMLEECKLRTHFIPSSTIKPKSTDGEALIIHDNS